MHQYATHFSRQRRAISAVIALVFGMAIVVGAVGVAYGLGAFHTGPPQCTINCTSSSSSSSSSAQASQGYFSSGYIDFAVSGADHFDPTVAYTPATNFNVAFLDKPNGNWHTLATNSATKIDIPTSDSATVYAEVTVPSGQNYYVDVAKIMAQNSGVVGVQYASISPSGTNEFIFQINLATVPLSEVSGQDPQYTFAVYLVKYALPTINSPSNLVSLGSAQTPAEFIPWALSFASTNVGAEITQVQLIVNDSISSVANLQSMNDPALAGGAKMITQQTQNGVNTPQSTPAKFVGAIGGNIGSSTAGSYQYTYNIASSTTDMSTAETLYLPTSTYNSLSYQGAFVFNFGASPSTIGGVSIEIIITVLTPSGSLATVTSTVTAAQGAVL